MRRGGIEIRCEASIMNGYHSKSKLEEIFVKTHNAEKMNTHNYEYRYVLKKIKWAKKLFNGQVAGLAW